jgi:CO/xanthine dehydrogenase Mo-binding subunit
VRSGKVELGQGIATAIALIAADELDVPLERVRVEPVDTERSPNEFITAGSQSIETSGSAVRQAAAEARRALLELAAERLDTPASRLRVEAGVVHAGDPARGVSYAELLGGRAFDRPVSMGPSARAKRPPERRLVGRAALRRDLPDKVFGVPRFVHDLELRDLVHARVVRPPGPGSRLLEVELEATRTLPGVIEVVRDGSFLGVAAEREEQALAAAEQLRRRARWTAPERLPDPERVGDWLEAHTIESLLVEAGEPVETPIQPLEPSPAAVHTLEATYDRPYQMHASLGPSCAAARFERGRLEVWTHSQGPFVLRDSLARVLDLTPGSIRVRHVEGPGCYGHNGADDVALDAALIARALPGRSVLVAWTREDEHVWEPYGPAMRVRTCASLDAGGRILDWSHDVWSHTHSGRPLPYPDASGLLAAWQLERPLPRPEPRAMRSRHGGIHRNADPIYTIPRRRIVKHLAAHGPLRTSSLRSLGAYANVFAIESFLDELASLAGVDPVELRLRHLSDERARAVVEAAVERAGWSPSAPSGSGRGRGIGFARYKNAQCYAAVVVELEVEDATAEVRLRRAVIAADAGCVIDPDGLTNQLEGGFVQSASWTLREAVRFDAAGVSSRDWESYPILGFADVPELETVLLDRPELPSLGAGEATQGPTAGAIANAIFHATGLRLRSIPFTPERLREAAARAGPERAAQSFM